MCQCDPANTCMAGDCHSHFFWNSSLHFSAKEPASWPPPA